MQFKQEWGVRDISMKMLPKKARYQNVIKLLNNIICTITSNNVGWKKMLFAKQLKSD
jgi:hypothetical protein